MPIHLHIGTHKTGTTAIQQVLRQHRQALAEIGIWYPCAAELLGNGSEEIPHLNFARSLHNPSRKKSYNDGQLRQMAAQIVRQSRQYPHTIISAESFWHLGFPSARQGLDSEQLWQGKAAGITRLRQLFGDADVRVTAVLRERSAYMQSFYSEWISATSYRGRFKQFRRQLQHYWDYGRQLQAWAEHFPVRAYAYESLCRAGALPQVFLERVCGEPLPQALLAAMEPTWSNPSDPLACIALKRFLNRLPLEHEPRQKLYRQYRRRVIKRSGQRMVAELLACNSWVTPVELMALRRSLAAGDEQIRQHFCAELVSLPHGWWECRRVAAKGLRGIGKGEEQRLLGWALNQWPPRESWFNPPGKVKPPAADAGLQP